MKTGIFSGCIIWIAALLLMGCNSTTKTSDTSITQQEKMTEVKQNVVGIKDDALNTVYQQYLLVSDALINSDMAAAKEAAMALELAAKALENSDQFVKLASTITAVSDIEKQRAVFSDLSNEMMSRIKTVGLKEGEVYLDYCPMALDDQGAVWLSNEKSIRNPYYGEKMMECGEVKETLK
ncbi:DUF3347 domain-containing protein [Sphingobacterium spiritivorum]|uniref:DUF3347 domain-containing protein n=1 Tax=Sphingobacterium spiritivorum ATCC 33861 TaxID=525373 RepID=D7VP00_SPHSI|nr:DUF3347 domain-containing protein [Sphingobacterium spiritivorum]EFK57647.1 hypothetical protein HMPREF0766_12720 [Sphingobacterium spiritivorum ATCC 33861]QQT36310.1 DUF3347 domain-containing protein [Sphingobacterium spiritivorum]WQD33050.1 DUF3347 domain-containing protein [Sphingobacterium spiritivorum]SUJ18599.1 Protein of uncharacterised function (DUF3347) [Sphingobacterium spiritivorum]